MRSEISLETLMRVSPSCSGGGLVYDVARLGDGANQLRVAGISFQLMSQPTDPCPEDLNIVTVFRSPHPGEELLIEHEATNIVGQLAEQKPLSSGQVFFFAPNNNAVPPEIDYYIP